MFILKFLIIITLTLLSSIINNVNCSAQNHLNTQLALLILSAGDNSGNIALDNNNNLLTIDRGDGKPVSIIDIIPSLKKEALHPTCGKSGLICANEKFRKLYFKAEQIYISKFGYTNDSNGNLLKYPNDDTNERAHIYMDDTHNTNLINNIDLFNHLVNDKSSNNYYLINSPDIKKIDIFDKNILNDYYNAAIEGIKSNSDINNLVTKITTKVNHNPKLYGDITKNIFSNNNFANIFTDKNAGLTLITDNINGNYHVIASYNHKLHHLFTLKYNGRSNKYEINNNFINDNTLSSDKIYSYNYGYNKKYGNKLNSDTEYLENEGISLIGDCGIILIKTTEYYDPDKKENVKEINLYKPEEYTIDYNHINKNAIFGSIATEEQLKELEVKDKNLICSYLNKNYYPIETLAGNFIKKIKK